MKSIIIAEDDQAMSQMLESALRQHGYEVRVSADGRDISKLCRSKIPDLVITDIFMPHIDGFQLMRKLRKEFPSVKIITISGNVSATELLPMAGKLGADRTFLKPFTIQEILDAVQSVLE